VSVANPDRTYKTINLEGYNRVASYTTCIPQGLLKLCCTNGDSLRSLHTTHNKIAIPLFVCLIIIILASLDKGEYSTVGVTPLGYVSSSPLIGASPEGYNLVLCTINNKL